MLLDMSQRKTLINRWVDPNWQKEASSSSSVLSWSDTGTGTMGQHLLARELASALSQRSRFSMNKDVRSTAITAKKALKEVVRLPAAASASRRHKLSGTTEQKDQRRKELNEELSRNAVARRVARFKSKFKPRLLKQLARSWLRAARKRYAAQGLRHSWENSAESSRESWRKYRREEHAWKAPEKPKYAERRPSKESKKRRKVKQKLKKVADAKLLRPKMLVDLPSADGGSEKPTLSKSQHRRLLKKKAAARKAASKKAGSPKQAAGSSRTP